MDFINDISTEEGEALAEIAAEFDAQVAADDERYEAYLDELQAEADIEARAAAMVRS